ncbi:hypothetical protein [Streptomyces sp. NRRL S-1022]|uniref:hypothetical protein n=1 Tax=Streptomyces sp. NRRL S-1022 TaxID=1463880 RepID=UPI00068DE54D|nr:hypothetical protein [Streptomyces sp. NRRL S-1022]
MGKGKWIAGGVVALFVIGAAGSCGGSDDSKADKPKPVRPTATASASVQSPSVPSPNAHQRAELLVALKSIDAGLVANEDRAVRRSTNVCSDIKGGKDSHTVKANAKYRFEGGNVPHLSDAQTERIVSAVKDTFCSVHESTDTKAQKAQKVRTKADAPKPSPTWSSEADIFKRWAKANGSPADKAAVAHVTRVHGAFGGNGMVDVYTDWTGGMFGGHNPDGKLVVSAYQTWMPGTGSGLVTVYDADGEILANGNF